MMLRRCGPQSVRKVTVVMLVILGMGVDTAPTDRDFPFSRTHASTAPEKSSALNLSHYLKEWLVSTKAAGVDGTSRTTTRTFTSHGTRAVRPKNNHDTAGPGKQAHMLKMISALEELNRTLNSTLSSRITIIPRANGRNGGRKHKGVKVPPSNGGDRTTTAIPAVANSTEPRVSTDAIGPSLTGRNFKKSVPPQNRKPNKRVCFWKYCSQN
uniref:Urotensin II-related peptide n=1 Tax=Cynoglossus semilaevis TaxID=244447 RepID=A0A3P8VZZ5_CYNSE